MGVRLLIGTYDGTQTDATVLVDSVSGLAFGPVFDSPDDAQDFLDWFRSAKREDACTDLGFNGDNLTDPRGCSEYALGKLIGAWQLQREEASV